MSTPGSQKQESTIVFRVRAKVWEKNYTKKYDQHFSEISENYAKTFFQQNKEACGLLSSVPLQVMTTKDKRNPNLLIKERKFNMPSTKTPYQLSNQGQQMVVTKEIS